MKNIWTKVATIFASLLGSMALATGALAVEATNSNTGADSNNEAEVTIQNNTTVSSNNTATINNNISISANTGSNSADKNTGDGWVSTGDIDFSVEITNDLNKNFVGAPLPQEPAGPGVPPAVLPPSAPKPGKVLAAVEGLPVTGGSLPNWPFLLIMVGFVTRLAERVLRTRFGEVA